jgi:hypothetical protein
MSFLKREVNWVEYVRDQSLADVFVWSVDQQTGGGGRKYKFEFSGRGELEEIRYTLDHQTQLDNTRIEIQSMLARVITSGLLPFEVQRGKAHRVIIEPGTNTHSTESNYQEDKWRNWVFDLGLSAGMDLESSRNEIDISGDLGVRHTSEEWRVRSDLDYNYELTSIHNTEYDFNDTYTRSYYDFSVVRSISEHWSVGLFLDMWDNSARNTTYGTRLNGALEFNFFPYHQSHFREFTIAYFIGPMYMKYFEETIYGKTSETLMGHQLSIEYRLQRKWGSLAFDLDGFHHLDDISKNRIILEGDARIRLSKGLSFRLNAEYQVIRDQIYLTRGDASLEELLLKRASLATAFNFDFKVGIVYTFGSIYNSVVNTRL